MMAVTKALLSLSCFSSILGQAVGSVTLSHRQRSSEVVPQLEPRQYPGVIDNSAFQRRAYQASTVAGNWLYIDGGEFAYQNQGHLSYQYSSTTLAIDLSKDWTNSTVLFKSTSKPNGMPLLSQTTLWYDESSGLLYTGANGRDTNYGNDVSPSALSLWSFKPDGAGSGTWSEALDTNDQAWGSLTRSVRGLAAYGGDSAFVLSGVANSQTSLETQDAPNDILLPGIVQFNMTTKKFTNSSARGYTYNQTAQSGNAQYVPSFGPNGLFLFMGGFNITDNDDVGIPLDNIWVYEPVTDKWYNQTASGNVPMARREACIAGVNSTNGTYEIFMYGGDNGNLGSDAIPYDEIFVLTLPAFSWIKVDYPPQFPRAGHSCNAVGGSQIVVVGGIDANAKVATGLYTDIWQSIFNSSVDPNQQGLGIFDMTTLEWASSYKANAGDYEQSDLVKQYYANNQIDGSQFNSPALKNLFATTHFTPARSSQSDSPSPVSNGTSPPDSSGDNGDNGGGGNHTGAIAGGVVGGVVFLALVAGVGYWLLFVRPGRGSVHPRPRTPELAGESSPGALNGKPDGRGYYEPSNKHFYGELNGQNTPMAEMEGARPEMDGGAVGPKEMEGEGHHRV